MSDMPQNDNDTPRDAATPAPAHAPALEPEPAPAPGGRTRRFLRGRPGLLLVGAVAGALLGAGTVAWRTDTLPLLPKDLCWGTLSEDTAFGMFTRKGHLEADELPLERADGNEDRVRGECRITRVEDGEKKWQIVVKVRDLDDLKGRDVREWPDEFLNSRMAPLGGEILGMASPSRAWAALPKGCTSTSGRPHAPTVVELTSGADVPYSERDEDEEIRAGQARTVVHIVNGLIRKYGCDGSYPDHGDLAPLAERHDVRPDGLCGIKGLRLPGVERERENGENGKGDGTTDDDGDYSDRYGEQRTPGKSGGVRSCEVDRAGTPELRLSTIEDPDLAEVFVPYTLLDGAKLRGDGYGTIGPDLAVYRLQCQTGAVAFVARRLRGSYDSDWFRELLPGYVRAEAKRIGCGDVTVTG
ncbi:hypothetical protein [Streptomyces sp. NPDC002851]